MLQRRLKIASFIALPLALYVVLSWWMSWRPRILRTPGKIRAVAYVPQSELLAAGGEFIVRTRVRRSFVYDATGEVQLWDTTKATLERTFPFVYPPVKAPGAKRLDLIKSLMLSRDGKFVMAASDRGDVAVLNRGTGQWSCVFEGQYLPSASIRYRPIAFSRDGYSVWIAKQWRKPVTLTPNLFNSFTLILLCRIDSSKIIRRLPISLTQDEWPRQFVMNPNERSVVCAVRKGHETSWWYDSGKVLILDTKTGRRLKTLITRHDDSDECMAISPNGVWIAISTANPTPSLWLYPTGNGQAQHLIAPNNQQPYAPVFSPDSKSVAATGGRGSIYLWDVQSNLPPRILGRDSTSLASLAFSSDSSSLATANLNGTIKIWRVK